MPERKSKSIGGGQNRQRNALATKLDEIRLEALSLFHENDKAVKTGEMYCLAEKLDDLDNSLDDHCNLWAEAEVSSGNYPVPKGKDSLDVVEELAKTLRSGSWFRLLVSYLDDGSTFPGVGKKWDRRRQSEPFLLLAVLRAVDGLMALDEGDSTNTAFAMRYSMTQGIQLSEPGC